MEEHAVLTCDCSFAGLKPIMVDLPYPPICVREKNMAYAGYLSIDYCGVVSELSAITQYINNETRLACENCPMARTILGIAVAEMMHLQKLGELIVLLGGTVDYAAKYKNGRRMLWTPEFLSLQKERERIIAAGIESERAAIQQYQAHIRMIGDEYVNAVLKRIIMDEEYHIMLLQALSCEK